MGQGYWCIFGASLRAPCHLCSDAQLATPKCLFGGPRRHLLLPFVEREELALLHVAMLVLVPGAWPRRRLQGVAMLLLLALLGFETVTEAPSWLGLVDVELCAALILRVP